MLPKAEQSGKPQNAFGLRSSVETGERRVNAAMHRTPVICLDLLGDMEDLNAYFRQWKSEQPDDPEVTIQKQVILRKRNSLFRPG